MTSSPGLPDGLTGRRGREAPHRQVQRARTLLMAADGVANTRIAASLGVTAVTVRAWLPRFAEEGLARSVRAGGPSRRSRWRRWRRSSRRPCIPNPRARRIGAPGRWPNSWGEPVHGAKDLARTGVWDCSRREFRPYPPSSETVLVTVFPTWARSLFEGHVLRGQSHGADQSSGGQQTSGPAVTGGGGV